MFKILVRCDQWLLRYSTFILRSLHYWNILQMNDTELVKRVFTIQKIPPCKNDWILQIREDLKVCGITHTESEIKSMKEYSFKKIVNEKIKEPSVKHLLSTGCPAISCAIFFCLPISENRSDLYIYMDIFQLARTWSFRNIPWFYFSDDFRGSFL